MFPFSVRVLLSTLLCCQATSLKAQPPPLPPTNLGITNMQDGNPPSSGWYLMQYVQSYRPDNTRNAEGQAVPLVPKVSSLLAMQQLVLITKKKMLGGNAGFTIIVPLVKLTAESNGAGIPSVNPAILGDLILGPLVQWFDRRIFGMEIGHRLEFDLTIPAGSWKSRYVVNPGSHLYRISPNYTFTLMPSKAFAISMRHYLSYYFNQIATTEKAGLCYNFNYSAEYSLTRAITIEAAGYFLRQLLDDAVDGDRHYYQDHLGISDTREQVFAVGPGIGFLAPSGLFLEIKAMWEASARNRPEGFRSTLVVSHKLSK